MKLTTLTLTAATLIAAGSVATAANTFSINPSIDAYDDVVDLSVVSSTQDGVVQIVDFKGNVLGEADVNAGANPNIRISLDGVATNDLTTQLLHNGQVVATGTVDVDRF